MKKTFLLFAACTAIIINGCTPVEIPNDEDDEPAIPEGMNLVGSVVDASGKGIEGVVVTDGFQCTATQADGAYYMKVDESAVKFIYISTPSGYEPPASNGLPVFYIPFARLAKSEGIYKAEPFKLTAVQNPDRATVLFTADPQPRASTAKYDQFAFHSLDCCQDLYRDLKETGESISGRRVFGVCLGDIVHENMDLYSDYLAGLSTLGYPTYNVIGNHDNNPSAANDESAAEDFESHFGPRNYSFNVGNIHFVVLDNLIMKDKNGRLTGYDQGLTDSIWDCYLHPFTDVQVTERGTIREAQERLCQPPHHLLEGSRLGRPHPCYPQFRLSRRASVRKSGSPHPGPFYRRTVDQ